MAKLLVVEDGADSRDVLATALSRAGHDVQGAPDGRQALSAILDDTPDLVVLDLLLPEMGGADLLEVTRSYLRLQSLPVVVLTGLPDSPLVERARHMKVNAILIKGKATLHEVIATINQELHRLPS